MKKLLVLIFLGVLGALSSAGADSDGIPTVLIPLGVGLNIQVN
jgi:hypothetical protein